MDYKNIRTIFSTLLMILLLLLTVVSGTIIAVPIHSNNSISFGGLSGKKDNIMNINLGQHYIFIFGLMIINGVITSVGNAGPSHFFFQCSPVKTLILIGFVYIFIYNPLSHQYTMNPDLGLHFYMKIYTNVSEIDGFSSKKLFVSTEYQLFSLFVIFPFNGLVEYTFKSI